MRRRIGEGTVANSRRFGDGTALGALARAGNGTGADADDLCRGAVIVGSR